MECHEGGSPSSAQELERATASRYRIAPACQAVRPRGRDLRRGEGSGDRAGEAALTREMGHPGLIMRRLVVSTVTLRLRPTFSANVSENLALIGGLGLVGPGSAPS
jgi:hypothetical protein